MKELLDNKNFKKPLRVLFLNQKNDYLGYLKKYFNITIIEKEDVLKIIEKVKGSLLFNKLDIIDMIVFTGGADISPALYGENIGEYTFTNEKRDKEESIIFNFFKKTKMLKLGICRGSQFLTVMNGGKLIQNVDRHAIRGTHPISFLNEGTEYNITSTHHQMMYPFDLDKEEYNLIAVSTFFRSTTYTNGDNKEINKHVNFLEPEIVYYPKTNSLAIQGHPEMPNCPTETKDKIIKIINEKLK